MGSHPIFTEEHDRLREEIRTFVEEELAPHTDEWEETTFPDHVMRRLGELGYLGLDKPLEYGGQGKDYFSALVLAEELYRGAAGGLAMAVAVQTDMAMPPILAFGTEAQKRQWAVPAIAGTKILALGITEPDAGSDVAAIKTSAVRDGDEWVINGSKTYITNGHRADVIVLVAKTEKDAGHGGITLFLVPMDAPGVIREQRLEKLGMHASDTALLAFQDVRVPDTAVLGEVGKGFYQIMWQLQGERIIGAAGNLATAERAIELTADSLRSRNQVSATTLHSQFARHQIAEMAMKLEASRALTYDTARNFAEGAYPVREISMSKLHMGVVTNEILDTCFQMQARNGSGRRIEQMLRDVRLNRIGGGTDEILRDVIGKGYGLEIFRDGLLDGQVALVTGGGSGIGRSIALELAGLGARVVVAGRRAEPLQETAALHDGIEAEACDIRDEEQVDALVDRVLERHGRIDLLVNNAGGQFLSPAEAITPKGFRTVIRLNLEGTWLMTHAVATKAFIPEGRGGKVVCVTLSPHTGLPSMAHSSAARAAVENLVRVLSTEWARYGIRLSAIAPGPVATDAFMEKYPQSVIDDSASSVPLGRMGRAEEVAWMVAHLASPAGDWVSGAVLTIDGGKDNWIGQWPPASFADAAGAPLAEERR